MPRRRKERVVMLTRGLVLGRIEGQAAEEKWEKNWKDKGWPFANDLGEINDTGQPDDTPTEPQNWLQVLCVEEQAKMDSIPEDPTCPPTSGNSILEVDGFEGVACKPSGSILPTNGVMDTMVLMRIKQGLGPREPEEEDILKIVHAAMSTSGPGTSLSSSEAPSVLPAYNQILAGLQASNRQTLDDRFGPGANWDGHRDVERKNLLLALDNRMTAMSLTVRGYRNLQELDQREDELMQALIAYRPEMADFKDKTPYNVMAVMLANQGMANPGLDSDMRDALVRAMLMDQQLRLHSHHRRGPNNDTFQARLASAQRTGNAAEIEHLGNEFDQLIYETFVQSAMTVLNDLYRARRNLIKRGLSELQDLTMLQTGQKWYATTLVPTGPEVLERLRSEEAEDALAHTLRKLFDDLEAGQFGSNIKMAAMLVLAKHCYSRTAKVAGEDIQGDKRQKEHVIRERLHHPDTPLVVLPGIVGDSNNIKRTAPEVLDSAWKLDSALQEVYKAAIHRYQTYAAAYESLGGGSEDDCEYKVEEE